MNRNTKHADISKSLFYLLNRKQPDNIHKPGQAPEVQSDLLWMARVLHLADKTKKAAEGSCWRAAKSKGSQRVKGTFCIPQIFTQGNWLHSNIHCPLVSVLVCQFHFFNLSFPPDTTHYLRRGGGFLSAASWFQNCGISHLHWNAFCNIENEFHICIVVVVWSSWNWHVVICHFNVLCKCNKGHI